MSLLKTVKETEASGFIKEVYNAFTQQIGKVPNVIKFYTASPEMFEKFMGLFYYFSKHTKLDTILFAYTRMIVSHQNNCEYCDRLQAAVLKFYGENETNIEQAREDCTKIEMDEKRKLLLVLAIDLINNNFNDIELKLNQLKSFGWEEPEILDLCVAAAMQRGLTQLIKGFKVEVDF